MPDRPDAVTDRLAKFTPSPGALDRDALLFAAGRQSARVSRLWLVATAVLAISQAATLVALWPRDRSVSDAAPTAPASVGSASELQLPPASSDPGLWSAGSRPEVLEGAVSGTAAEFVSAGPPLTAGSPLRVD